MNTGPSRDLIQFFKEQFDLPAQRIQLDHFFSRTQFTGIGHQDLDVI